MGTPKHQEERSKNLKVYQFKECYVKVVRIDESGLPACRFCGKIRNNLKLHIKKTSACLEYYEEHFPSELTLSENKKKENARKRKQKQREAEIIEHGDIVKQKEKETKQNQRNRKRKEDNDIVKQKEKEIKQNQRNKKKKTK